MCGEDVLHFGQLQYFLSGNVSSWAEVRGVGKAGGGGGGGRLGNWEYLYKTDG